MAGKKIQINFYGLQNMYISARNYLIFFFTAFMTLSPFHEKLAYQLTVIRSVNMPEKNLSQSHLAEMMVISYVRLF